MSKTLRIATRKSPLALWQAEFIQSALMQLYPDVTVELLAMSTKGDKILDAPLAKVGGKGLFVKELENALLEGRADLAVHSMKDVPMEFPSGLGLSVICERFECRDAFVSNHFKSFSSLPAGARVGTSSLRRQCQLRGKRNDLEWLDLRGNVNTRLAKLDAGEYDALILAGAGLQRLGFDERITEFLSPEVCLPAGGQGALGIEIRDADTKLAELLAPLNHRETAICVRAERAVNNRLEGGCQVPIACYATLSASDPTVLQVEAMVGSPDGERQIASVMQGLAADPEALGIKVAESLLNQGAAEILAAVYG